MPKESMKRPRRDDEASETEHALNHRQVKNFLHRTRPSEGNRGAQAVQWLAL